MSTETTEQAVKPTKKILAYTAGPDGFSEATYPYLRDVLIPLLEKLGITVLNPWTMIPHEEIKSVQEMPEGPEKTAAQAQLRLKIGAKNVESIGIANIIVANLDGQDVDSGTASEIGVAAMQGKPVFGRRSDMRMAGELGALINLQVEYFIRVSGGKLVHSHDELETALREYVAAHHASVAEAKASSATENAS